MRYMIAVLLMFTFSQGISKEMGTDQAFSYIRSGMYNEALELLKQELIKSPNDWNTHYLTGFALRGIGNYDVAIIHYKRAIDIQPSNAQAYLALGIALQLNENYTVAISSFKKAIDIHPNLIEAYNSIGLTYAKLENHRDALGWYAKGRDKLLDMVSAEVHKDPDKCYKDEIIDGENTRTLLPYIFIKTEELLMSNILYSTLTNNMGVSLMDLGAYDEAKSNFEESTKYIPVDYIYADPKNNLEILTELYGTK